MRQLPRWPLLALYLGFPVWWLLGLGAFIWPVLALPMLGSLLLRGRVRFPAGFGLWFAFLAWMLGSGIELDSAARVLGWSYRASLYLAAAVLFLYVYNIPRDRLPPRTIALVLTGFWAFVVVGGYLGLLFPQGSFTTVVEHLMPASLMENSLVSSMVHPAFAQTSGAILGVAPRPQAPFTYTNEWGGNFALLVPMVLTAMSQTRSGGGRILLALLLPVGLVPAALSLNRGLFLSLGAGLVYAALRYAIRGRVKAMIGITVVVAVAGAVFAVLPVKQLLEERLTTSATNQTRASLYAEARDRVAASPLLGYGAPRPSDVGGGSPSVGTQGQFWMVLFSHGIPGAALFTAFFLWAVWRTRRALTGPWFWGHVTLVIATVQLPIYGLLPAQLFTVMIALAVALRGEEALARRRAPARGRATTPSIVGTRPA
ncbi:MAG TPA: O-antigen ligase family protein [Actinomycetes bacterium]|nr:O-antigen ligase family protein [Actinomycetes bacterium]